MPADDDLRRQLAPGLSLVRDDRDDRLAVAAYCGSGVSAARDVLALAVLGVDAALFPGSWSAWSNGPRPTGGSGTRAGCRPARRTVDTHPLVSTGSVDAAGDGRAVRDMMG